MYDMEVRPEAKNQRDTDAWGGKLSVTIGTFYHTQNSKVDGRMECQQHRLHSPTELSSYLILVITKIPTFFCLLLLIISWISLQSPHASSFTFLTYYISTSNIDTTPTLNITYSPLINILQKIKETLLDINCPFFNQSTFSLLKNDLLEETGALTFKSFKNKEDIVPALQLPSKGKISRSQITKT